MFSFIISHVIMLNITSSSQMILYSYTISRARWYYLMGTTTCIPSFWLLSRILEKLSFYFDLGALTSGPAFHFEKKEGEKAAALNNY